MGLLFLTSYVMVCVLCLGCYFCHIVFNRFTLCVLGMVDCVWCWFHLVSFCWSQCSYLCSVLWHLLVFILFWEMGLVFFWFLLRLCVWKFTCVCGFGLPILYHCVFVVITCVCFCLECITLIHSIFYLICPTAIFLVVCGFHCAFQTHGRLSYWQLSLSLSYSVLYALSPLCCTCLILYCHDLCLKLCVIYMVYIHFWI